MSALLPALTNPAAAVPEGLTGPHGRPAGRRFDVYRNNVAASLTEALVAGFPVIQKLLGDRFFRAMAGVYLRASPPSSPVLMTYGASFPAFLEGFAPVAHLPYLADTARLELALREAYHAADAAPLDPAALDTPALMGAVLTLAPAVRLVASPYPIHAIWRANTEAGAPPAAGGAQTVLVTRPALDPLATPLAPEAARFVAALLAGRRFDAALKAAGEGLDLTATLTLLLAQNALTHLEVLP